MRLFRNVLAALLLLSIQPAGVLAQEVEERDALSHFASIEGPQYVLVRLPLPPEVIALSAADLSDVRVLDDAGEELPYVVDREEHAEVSEPVDRRESLTPLSASQTRSRTSAAVVYREVFLVTLPAHESTTELALELETDAREFTATARATGLGVAVSGTVFRIPAMGAERLFITLPPNAAGPIELTLESEAGFLAPRLSFHERSAARSLPRLERELEIVESRMEGTTQVLELSRPQGLVPVGLRIATASTTFASRVTVDVRSADAGARSMGAATIYRVPPLGEDLPGAEELRVPVDGELVGDRLVVRLERGDSPPLEAVRVVAELRTLALVFENQVGATLRFGGARLRARRYDIAFLSRRLGDPSVARATLGPVEENPNYQHEPLLTFAMRPGAEVDRSTFTTSAPLTLPESPEGLTRVELTPELLARAAGGLVDLRIVSADGRQWPYVLAGDRREVVLDVPVTRTVHPQRANWSRYTLGLPVAQLAPFRITIDPVERFFSRSLAVSALSAGPDAIELIVAQSYGERDGSAAAAIPLDVPEGRYSRLFVDVEDGSEAPLTISSVRVALLISDLLVTAPAGEYEVLVGDTLATTPSYDLARVEARVLENVAISTAVLGPLTPNPRYHVPTFLERSGWQTVVLWVVLVVSVLLLLGLTMRLSKSEPEPIAAPASPSPSATGAASDAEDDAASPDGAERSEDDE